MKSIFKCSKVSVLSLLLSLMAGSIQAQTEEGQCNLYQVCSNHAYLEYGSFP